MELRPSLVKRIQRALPCTPDLKEYDLFFRPALYWEQPGPSLLATVLPEHVRLMDQGGFSLSSSATQAALEAVHPGLMGGSYLPPLLDWEVEIARAVLSSVTLDVISFRARPMDRGIAYRVVDEYGDEGSAYAFSPIGSTLPLTFGELILQVASAQRVDGPDLHPSLLNLGKALSSPAFVRFSSAYYPELGRFFAEEAWL